jgi:glycosyltransferase involved in cell wall biosynthesis
MTRSAEAAAIGAARAPMRLLIVTDEMEVGGTQRQIVHLARGLHQRGHHVTVLYFRERSFLVDELERDGVGCVEVPKRGKLDPGFVLRLSAEVRRLAPDVIHGFAFSGELWSAVAHLQQRGDRSPVLVTSVRGLYEWYRPWQWRLKRWVAGRSAHVVSNSREAALYACRQMGLPETTIDVIYNGAEIPDEAQLQQRRGPTRAALGLAPEVPAILFVGRLVALKNVPVLLRALRRLVDAGLRPRLLIAGDGPERGAIEQLIAQLGLGEQAQLLGQRSDVPDLMAAADVVVLPSLREGLSNVILEGMMSGRAVVGSRVGGTPELIDDGVSGWMFESDNDTALAAVLQRLVTDSSGRERLGAQARAQAVARFGIPAMVQAYEQLYGAASQGRRTHPHR